MHDIAIIGGGPRGVCVLERIRANAPELLPQQQIRIHLIDPFPFGAGRLWRQNQSPLMLMNSRTELVTMFTDEAVEMAGPVWPGPDLVEWVAAVRAGEITVDVAPDVHEEIATLADRDFVPRRVHGAYLSWVYRHIVAELPPEITVSEYSTKAVELTANPESSGAKQYVWLANSDTPLEVDVVMITNGHLDGKPSALEAPWLDAVAKHGLRYFPPAYTADVDYSDIAPGEKVLVRGTGMAFNDLVTLLTQGRDGRFVENGVNDLNYIPSGNEPILYVGSRRGLPYHAKASYKLTNSPSLPRFFTKEIIDEIIRSGRPVNFRNDVWPHIAKEINWGYYSELWASHPDKVATDFDVFAKEFTRFVWDSDDMRRLIKTSVPQEEDRLDLQKINDPTFELTFSSIADADKYVLRYIEDDMARRANSDFSADLGAIAGFFSVFDRMPLLVSTGVLDAESISFIVDGWWFNLFGHFVNGPPAQRAAELYALHKAGLVRFIGPEMAIQIDEAQGLFVASSDLHHETVTARTLVDARIPSISVKNMDDQLMRSLFAAGGVVEESAVDEFSGERLSSGRIVIDRQGRLIEHNGKPNRRRFALGPNTSSRIVNSFTVPGVNPPCFQQNDLVVRELLATLATDKETVAELADESKILRMSVPRPTGNRAGM